jgi:predicted dehydrogenase
MKTIKAAVIGLGFIGKHQIDAIRRVPGVEVAAVCTSRPEAPETRFIPRVYSNWQALVSDPELEVVHNCTPNHLHDEINRAAIESGKHIYSEKPLSLSATVAKDLWHLAEKKGVAHGLNHQYRMNAAVQEMKARIKKNNAGRPLFVFGHYLQESHSRKTDYSTRLVPETSPARALADIGTHWADTAYCVMGQPIVSVMADMLTHYPVRIDPSSGREIPVQSDDTVSVLLRFADGTPGTMTASKVAGGHKNDLTIEVDGELCSYSWCQEQPDHLRIGSREQGITEFFMGPAFAQPEALSYVTAAPGHVMGWSDGLWNAIRAFYESLRTGRYRLPEQQYATFKDGWRTILFIEACIVSSREKRWVDIPYDE